MGLIFFFLSIAEVKKILEVKSEEQKLKPNRRIAKEILGKFFVTPAEMSSSFSSPITPINRKSSTFKQH